MAINSFKRIRSGWYQDYSTKVMLVKQTDSSWILCIENFKNYAFVTKQWDKALATYQITGFRTLKEAKDYDFFHLLHRTDAPSKDKNGTVISVPVRGLGRIPVTSSFSTKDLKIYQNELF